MQYTHPSMALRPSSSDHTADKHSPWIIALHWSSVIAILIATSTFFLREIVETSSIRNVLLDLHRQSGLFVMVALALRISIRIKVGMTDHAEDMHWMMRFTAKSAHGVLYLILAALPVLGWAATNAHAVPVKLFGIIPLPNIAPADSDLADTLTDYHLWAAWALLAVVISHIGAALWHHFHRKDKVLKAMLPG